MNLETKKDVAISIAKLIIFLSKKDNWVQHSFCKEKYDNGKSYCIVGALDECIHRRWYQSTKSYLENAVVAYVNNKKLNINTGKYPLNLATFNDNVPYELVMAFLHNTYTKLVEEVDNNIDKD